MEWKFRAWDKLARQMCNVICLNCHRNEDHIVKPLGGDIHDDFYNQQARNLVIMASTGLSDKNGQEIFEGDVIDAHPDGTHRYLRRVEWDDELAQFRALFPDGSGQLFTKHHCLTMEVIGNIHANPELLDAQA